MADHLSAQPVVVPLWKAVQASMGPQLAIVPQHTAHLTRIVDEVLLADLTLDPRELDHDVIFPIGPPRWAHEPVDEVGAGAEGIRVCDVVAGCAEIVIGHALIVDGADEWNGGYGLRSGRWQLGGIEPGRSGFGARRKALRRIVGGFGGVGHGLGGVIFLRLLAYSY